MYLALSKVLQPNMSRETAERLAQHDWDKETHHGKLELQEARFLDSIFGLVHSRTGCSHQECMDFALGVLYHTITIRLSPEELAAEEAARRARLDAIKRRLPDLAHLDAENARRIFAANPHMCGQDPEYHQCRCGDKFLAFLNAYNLSNDSFAKQSAWMAAYELFLKQDSARRRKPVVIPTQPKIVIRYNAFPKYQYQHHLFSSFNFFCF